jgi:hypothetical protein
MELNFYENETVYVVDTSALIMLEYTYKYDNPVFMAIWEEIEELIQIGCFRTIDFVEDEINTYEGNENFLKKWIKKWRKHLVHQTDTSSITASIPIINEEYNSGFLDAKKQAQGKEEADPYLLGYCKTHNYVLITNESKIKLNKIPAIAKKHNIKCIDINDFLKERGLRMERKRNNS